MRAGARWGRRRDAGLFGRSGVTDRFRGLSGLRPVVILAGYAVRRVREWYDGHAVRIFLVAWLLIVVGGFVGARLLLDL